MAPLGPKVGPILGAIDIGGTKIECALGTPAGDILASTQFPTGIESKPASCLQMALDLLNQLSGDLDCPAPSALGVACPGPFLQPAGTFLEVPNLPRWQGFELLPFLQDRSICPVRAMNDANAGVLSEVMWGAAQGAQSAIFLTMSTGMGAGLFLNGRLYEGPEGFAGEVGHLRLAPGGPLGFGKRGSAEGFLSGPGMVQVAESLLEDHPRDAPPSRLVHEPLTPESLCAAATTGDSVATAAIDFIAHKLGALCAMLVDLFEPQVIVLGTIGCSHPNLFIPTALKVMHAEALPRSMQGLVLTPSSLPARGTSAALAIAATHMSSHG